MADATTELGEHIAASLPGAVTDWRIEHGELTVSVRAPAIAEVLTFLRRDAVCQFRMLIDITAVDHPGREQRFDLVYILLSLPQNQRVRIKAAVAEGVPVASATSIFKAAGWFEREVWDLFGIPFAEHPDMRRLLTDYGFEGHPLRKDFPLTGHVELRYDEQQKRVVYEPVKLVQEFRTFDFESPWEGMVDVLHGDEKATVDPDDEARTAQTAPGTKSAKSPNGAKGTKTAKSSA